jgi:hypothetical protein
MKTASKTAAPTTYRQGDVLLLALSDAPAKLTPRTKGPRVILAHGDATGHHHSFPRQAVADFTDAGGGIVIVAKEGAVLEHQEHSPIPVPAGVYSVIRQREYTPSAIRNVAD